MRITKIRLLGFKSFAAKTEFVLDPGITGIVGPNGCGKSNVFDAVKWVLGEQRPSSLRAREMMDVIFSGAGSRKPLGMAEVSIVFDNEDHSLPVEQAEAVLTRRLYRSGESEYLLNGEPCRLKDLREALMDTGSSLDAFSIMEQGRIDAILTANPVERRAVFEEAAGIGKFKARRKETMRRLERVAEDLTRLRDVIELTDKQLRSLRYQASRAKRWREISEELRRQKVSWALNRYHGLLAEREEVAGKLTVLSAEEAQAGEALRGLLQDVTTEETDLERAALTLRNAEGVLLALDADIRSGREASGHGRRMAEELGDRVKRYEEEIRLGEARLTDTRREGESLADEQAALAAETAVRDRELAAAEEAARNEVESERGIGDRLAARRRERLAALARRTEVRNERAALSSMLKSGVAQRERIGRRRETIRKERERLSGSRAAGVGVAAAARSRAGEVRERLRLTEEEAESLRSRQQDFGEQAAECDRSLSAAGSRLEVLKSLRARREGMDRAVQEVMKRAALAEGGLSGIRGVVADLVEVDAAEAGAVELALGPCAQAIVTETLGDAIRAIEWLKGEALGRALFIPLSEVREAGPVYGGNGVARRMVGAVRTREEYRPVVQALLADSIAVENVDRALEVAREHGRALRIVTGGGEVLNRIGAISGGRGKNTVALLARNAEIDGLAAEVAAGSERREALREALSGLSNGRARLTARIAELREEAEAASTAAREAEARVARTDEELRRLEGEEKVLASELSEIEGESAGAAARDGELAVEDERLTAREEALGAEIASLETDLSEARERGRGVEERRTEARVGLARAKERLSAAEHRAASLAAAARDLSRGLDLARVERENCARRRDQAALDAELGSRRAAEAEAGREARIREVEEAKRRHEEGRERLSARRREADGIREEHDRYRAALSDFRLREGEIRTKVEGLLDRVRDEFSLDLADLYQGFTPEPVDQEALDRSVADLKDKLEKMGNVNLEALDQLKEVEERAAFLSREEADLVKGKESLTEILRKLNRESRERFEQAFVEIQANFREMFRKLFGGGNAEIRLTEGEDILEAGIDITVRPPGRDMVNLNSLSGGEKTLTAVALLFAIFKTRPSPFALMDEVDAALDESNIDRFLTLLREFTDKSQFLIVTHNKRTMAEADALYGVSMPEIGVSQPVSIRFRRVEAEEANLTGGEPVTANP
ncbi:MAG: chromosome segregation protein SMC [Planctomycetes bacterium]|jgi:chromosome segregation protein|nr:chromosome segregation protein SMC [Planctomycetota bacterium]